MSRYIDAEKIEFQYLPLAVLPDMFVTRADIKKIPTADVMPVVHAKWEKIQRTKRYVDEIGIDAETGKPFVNKIEYKYDEYRCPVCKKFARGDYLRFCDYCGARFDEMFEEKTDDTEIH